MASETQAPVSSCVDAGGGAIGMPQLCPDWMGNQIFWLVVTLVVIFLILSKVALPRIAAVLAERQGRITNDIAVAEDLRQKARDAEAAYEKALAEAKAEAGRIVAEAKDEMQAEMDVEIAKADAEIAAQAAESEKKIAEIREGALDAVKDVAMDTVPDIVAAMGGKADAKSVKTAVNERMKG